MKKLLLVLTLLLPAVCLAQGAGYTNTALTTTSASPNSTTRVVSYATVRVCTEPATGSPCSPLSTIYGNPALSGSPLPNPMTADVYGNYTFYVSPGTYHIQITGTGIKQQDLPYVSIGLSVNGSVSPGTQYQIPIYATTGQTLSGDSLLTDNGTALSYSGGGGITSANGFTGPLTGTVGATTPNTGEFTILQKVCNAAAASGADIGAKINSCIASLGGTGEVFIPGGSYNFSTTASLNVNGVTVRGAGQGSTVLNYTGSGVAIDMNTGSVITRSGLYDLTVTTNNASATAIKAGGLYQTIQNVSTSGTSAKMIYITGISNPSKSFGTHIINVDLEGYTAIGMMIDNSVDVYITDARAIAVNGNTTAQDLVIDSGTSGIYVVNMTTGYGLHNLVVKNSAGGGTFGWNNSPQFLFFTHFIGDGAGGGDGYLFDSTLASNFTSAHFVNSWAASAGANGIHISGGGFISFDTGRILNCQTNGVLLDTTAYLGDIEITNTKILSNNQSNASDAHGIYVKTSTNPLLITGNNIGNAMLAGGNQKYGVKLGAYDVSNLILSSNDLSDNATGPFLDNSTGVTYPSIITGNQPYTIGSTFQGYVTSGAGFRAGAVFFMAGGSLTGDSILNDGSGYTKILEGVNGFYINNHANSATLFSVNDSTQRTSVGGGLQVAGGYYYGGGAGTLFLDNSGNGTFASVNNTGAYKTGGNTVINSSGTLGNGTATLNTGSAIFASKRNVSGCTTGASQGNACGTAITVTWPGSFADTNYSAGCTPVGAPTNYPGTPYVVTKAVGSMTVNYIAMTAAAASWPNLDCWATHD